MAGQDQHRLCLSTSGPEILDIAEGQRLNSETQARKPCGNQGLTTGIHRGDGRAPDQFHRELEGGTTHGGYSPGAQALMLKAWTSVFMRSLKAS
jgi:hypothetical protein